MANTTLSIPSQTPICNPKNGVVIKSGDYGLINYIKEQVVQMHHPMAILASKLRLINKILLT